MRVAFLGNAEWSVPSLEAVSSSDHYLALALTRTPRPARRGGGMRPTPVAEAARRLALPLLEVETVRSGPGFDALVAARPDILAVVAYGEILPQHVLDLPAVAPVNVHFSLLPQLRGAAPVQRAIMEGMDETGVTTIRMDAGMDTGPILLQRTEPIGEDDDAGALGDRLARIGGRVLVETIDGLERGILEERPQSHHEATYASKIGPADRLIDWTDESASLIRRIRALAPEPGAQTAFRGKVLKVLGASRPAATDGEASTGPAGRPGTIRLVTPSGPAVDTGDGQAVVLESVAPEGRRRMTGAEFVRGYRPERGEVLG